MSGGMLLTGVHQIAREKTCPSFMLSTTNLTWTGSELSPGLSSERPASSLLGIGRHLKIETDVHYTYVQFLLVPYKEQRVLILVISLSLDGNDGCLI